MKNLRNFNIYNRLQNLRLHSLITLFVFAGILSATDVFAQKNSSGAELRLAKRQNPFSGDRRFQTPQEDFMLNGALNRSGAAASGGALDSTYNASVTESFGYVSETVVQPDGKIIAVGSFHRANGTKTNGIARFNADGTLDASFNAGTGASSVINAVALQPDGKIIVVGGFSIFNNQAVKRIVRLNSDGSMDAGFSLSVNFTTTINDVELQPDGKILVGGLFSLSGARVVRLNADGTFDAGFTGISSNIYSIVYTPGGKILIGKSGGSSSNPTILRLNLDGSPDPTFNSLGNGPNLQVSKLVVQPDGKILASGLLTEFNGTPTDGIVRLNDNGSLDTVFDYLSDPAITFQTVDSMKLQPDGKILIGYYYETTTGFFARVARLNAGGTIDATFTTGEAERDVIKDLNVLSDGKILVGGSFLSYNNQTKLRLIKLNSDGTFDNTFNPSVSTLGAVYAIKKQADGKVIIGGDFDFVNGVRKGGIARLNTNGTLDDSFDMGKGFDGDIYSMLIQPDGKIIAGGNFVKYKNDPAFNLARINSDGSFNANLNNYSETDSALVVFAYAMALQSDGKLIVGGFVYNANGLPSTAARINPNGTVDNTFTTIQNLGSTRAIVVQPDDKIVIGGTFTSQPGFLRSGIARLNSDGTLDSGFSIFSSQIYALARQPDGKIIAGGFTIGRYNADGTGDSTFSSGTGVDSLIRAIDLQPDGKIVIGGNFSSYNGTTANRIARINPNGTIDSTFNPAGTPGNIFSVAVQSDGKILAGGAFLEFNNTGKLSLVRLQGAASIIRAPFDFDGDGKTDISIFRPSNGEWWYLRSIDGGNYAAQFGNSLDKLVPGDFTGDGRADIAIWRPSSGEWFILRSEDGSYYSFPFGTNGDIPTVGDFDGDGKADQAVFRPTDSTWYIRRSSDGGFTIQQFGAVGDVPVVSDYDGDGKSDIAIWRASVGQWWIQRSSNQSVEAFTFGNSTDKPVQGDYTGDGKADVAIFRPSTGEWFILRSEDFSYYSFPFGTTGDIPAPGDYDGDGKFDAAVFRPSDTNWYLQRTTAGFTAIMFGFSTDKPVPNAFVP